MITSPLVILCSALIGDTMYLPSVQHYAIQVVFKLEHLIQFEASFKKLISNWFSMFRSNFKASFEPQEQFKANFKPPPEVV